jgi:hypothetical protein
MPVSIVTRYRVDNRETMLTLPAGARVFFTAPKPLLGLTHLVTQWLPEMFLLEVNWPGRLALHFTHTRSMAHSKIISITSPASDAGYVSEP